ncbi:hypothetical protein LSTR_LSTR002028 [Laodelphax striatellus]|uniref:Transferrin n=1 Tax=Laodelphax striatellus TaxID=195883 RepID=A0A482XHB9_LAOST|nr:hypothetical protein LSTR_LSTR002028 [Laodelphax striatellus]
MVTSARILSTKLTILLVAVCVSAVPTPHHHDGDPERKPGTPTRLCVPDSAYKGCLKMVEQGASVGVHMECVMARDRLECLDKIENHKADWGAVDPEDMFIAANLGDQYLKIFKEIRTKEEPEMEFRYEAVAVVHKDLEISSLEQLRGLRSCHTGVGRNVGYKIPMTKLSNMGILGPMDDASISPRENELKALSSFFSKACIVGKWSPDEETNQRLKSKYSNLCALCESPAKCDYPDVNSGYEGALHCLTKGDGQIAWTKTYFVKKVFGMAYAKNPATTTDVKAEDYAYLCQDGSKKPLTGPPCTWAARPWQGYMANTEINSELTKLKEDITKLNNLGETNHADWISTVLALNEKTLAVDNNGPYSPKQYLEKAKYYDVMERVMMKPKREARMCVVSDVEKAKCMDMKRAAFSRDIRPSFACIQKSSVENCLKAVQKKEADFYSMDAGYLEKAESVYELEPILTETVIAADHKASNYSQYMVAVVKKSSDVKFMPSAQRGCIAQPGQAAYELPLSVLIEKMDISAKNCQRPNIFSQFFKAGIMESENPMKCLESLQGDMAIVTYEDAKRAEEASPGHYEILCDGNKRSSLADLPNFHKCSMGQIPTRMIVACKDMKQVDRDDAMFALMSASEFFMKNPHIFRMFGQYSGEMNNVLFTSSATGLENSKTAKAARDAINDYKKVVGETARCTA